MKVAPKPIAREAGARASTVDAKKETGSLGAIQATPTSQPGHATKKHARLTGADTRPGERWTSAIDGAVGKNLKGAISGRTLSSAAANQKHLAKMEESTQVVSVVERLPGRLGSVTSFKPKEAFQLYEHCFPNPDEREPIEDIKARLKTYDKGPDADGGCFHAQGFADRDGHVVAYAQGSTVPSAEGLFYYWQYGCVADRDYMKETYGKDVNPREHGVLNTIHAVNAATLQATCDKVGQPAIGLMWESEPRGLGEDRESIRFTDKRLSIHNRAGGRVMMGKTADGELVNLHLQPRLTKDSAPIALHVMFRPLSYEEGDEAKAGMMKKSDAESMMMGWIENFRREGFDPIDVKEAEDEIKKRFARCAEIVLLPASEVPDAVTLAKTDPILEEQLLKMYDVSSLEQARSFYDAAMG
jgi:hypothetical protein